MAIVCTFAPAPAQLAVLGALISILAALFLSYLEQEDDRERRRRELLEKLAVPLTLAPEHELFDQHVAFCEALTELAGKTDPILCEIAVLKLASVNGQIASLANGRVDFASTEAWRTVYDKLLKSPDIKQYHSVAWVRSKDYWQNPSGRRTPRDQRRRGPPGRGLDSTPRTSPACAAEGWWELTATSPYLGQPLAFWTALRNCCSRSTSAKAG